MSNVVVIDGSLGHAGGMGEAHITETEIHKPRTRFGELGRLQPRKFADGERKRAFHRERRRGYLAAIQGPPSVRQAELIELKIAAEWNALKLEAEIKAREAETGKIDVVNRKLAIAYRSQEGQHGRDLDATMRKPSPRASGRTKAGPPQIDLAQHIDKLGVAHSRQAANGAVEAQAVAVEALRLDEQADLFGEVPQDD